ncbi:TetR/AcrR family transcriptional regulator [Microbacterium album]|uniref:TetR family transcriptional regulator n=1 Tax=Microbacterium album TaxID=2053191 RepID=A0A917MM82_9MICO|nr:TetR/AcrR family transcriptional regulator [Microbacterium album]GGH47214.1 TetR family transcriptional regulator [Microbacterium album]
MSVSTGKPAPTGTRLSGEVRRQQIRDAAARLFDRYGYHETSMDRIAEAVGIRKASLYYYFPSKDRLLVEMHDEMIERVIASHEARLGKTETSPTDLIVGIMIDLISLQETHPGSLRVFFEHRRELPEGEQQRVAQRRDRYAEYLRDAIQAGIACGAFREVDVTLTSLAILGMCNWSYQWFRSGGTQDAATVARSFWAVLSEGLVAP